MTRLDFNNFVLIVLLLSIFGCILNSTTAQHQPHLNGTRRVFKQEREVKALAEFRKGMSKYLYKDYMREDIYLLRWLRDQYLDVDAAKQKLLNSLHWRKENGVDAILSEDFYEILKQCPYDLSGRDKKGRPFLTASLANCHLRKIMLSGRVEKLNRALIHLLESMCAIRRQIQNETAAQESVNWMVIADMGGLSLREHMCPNCIPFFLNIVNVYFSHYPQLFQDIYIINTSRVTITLIELLQTFAPATHEESLYAFGYDKAEWQAELLRIIDANQLSRHFGGKKGIKVWIKIVLRVCRGL